VKEPKHESMKIKSPFEANSGRVTNQGERAVAQRDSLPQAAPQDWAKPNNPDAIGELAQHSDCLAR